MPTILAWRRAGKIGQREHHGEGNFAVKYLIRAIIAEGPPVPIPNTEVKLCYADNTWLATAREDRSKPTPLQENKGRSLFSCFIYEWQAVKRQGKSQGNQPLAFTHIPP